MKRFVQWLPLLILIPLWGSGLVLDRIVERVLLDSMHERLVTALHAHQRHVLTMLAHQQRGLKLYVGGAVQALSAGRAPRLDAGYLTSLLPEMVGCVLLDAEQRPVTRIGAAWPTIEEIATEFQQGTAESRVTDPHQGPTGLPVYDVYTTLKVEIGGQPSPLSNPQSTGRSPQFTVIGTLACRMKDILSQALAEHRVGLGLTGEVYLVSAKTHLMLTESRFIPNAVGRVKVDTIGMREALKMRNGIAPYPDYRGIPVIGTFLYLRDYDWVLLSEMDETEALAPLVHLRMVLGLILGLISVVTGVVGWQYGRRLSETYAMVKDARDLARQDEAQVKALLRSMTDAVFEIDESSTILLANESAHHIFGWPSGGLIGQKATVLMPPEDVIKHEAGLKRYLETDESRIIGKCIEVTGLRRDGSRFPCELSVAAMTLPDGARRFIGVHRDITERKEAHQALQASEKRFRTLVETTRDWFWEVNENVVYTYASPRTRELLGYAPEEVIGKTPFDLMPPDEARRVAGLFSPILAAREPFTLLENINLHKDGHKIVLETNGTPIFDSQGVFRGYHGTDRDITERKKTEEALEQAHAALNVQYRELQATYAKIEQAKKEWEATFDAIADPLFIHDQEFRIVRANQAYADAAGMTPVELLGRPYYKVFPRMDGPLKKCLKAMEQGGREEEEEEEHVPNPTPGKRYRTRLFAIQDSTGKHVRSIHVMEDFTERKRMEDELRASAEYVRSLIEASLDPLVTTSRDGKITDVNKATEGITGVPRERLIGSDFSEYCTEPEKARAGYRRVLAEGAVRDYPLTLRHASGQTTDVLYNAAVYCNQAGDVQGVFATAWDITERKHMQEQGTRMERLAALGQLLGGIAHELRNPLFIITGRLQLMKEMLANREYNEAERNIQIIEEASTRMTVITQRFLQLSRPVAPRWERCSVQDVLTQMLDFLANELMKNRINVIRSDAPDLPPTRSEPRQLHEVFLNIVMNAMQAMTAAHGHGTLTITTLRKDDWIETRIQDDGPGIAPRHRARLFEPFFSTKPPEQGTGLGLWTVRSILAELNGTVECESVEGQGATFIIRIPIVSYPPKE